MSDRIRTLLGVLALAYGFAATAAATIGILYLFDNVSPWFSVLLPMPAALLIAGIVIAVERLL